MSKKRYFAAFGAAGLVFAGVFGAAAALDVDSAVAQAGQDEKLSCQTNTLKVDGYQIEQGTGAEPLSRGLNISNIDKDCKGLWLSARVLDGTGNLIANSVVEITGSTATPHYQAKYGPTLVPVSQIKKVSLAIT